MAEIVALPDDAKVRAAHRRLARWFRELADYIEADELETEPHAAMIVLTGSEQHEVLIAGYSSDVSGCNGAMYAAQTVLSSAFRTAGGNIRPRDHSLYGLPLRKANIVDFTAAARKSKTHT